MDRDGGGVGEREKAAVTSICNLRAEAVQMMGYIIDFFNNCD